MILVLGIDAATWTMIDPNIDRLPAFKKLCEIGNRDTIHLKEKPLSPSIWCGMFCGKTFEQHGHDSFAPGGNIAKRQDIKVDFIWDILDREGKKVMALGVPFVVPPYSFNVDFKPVGFGLPTNEKEWDEELERITSKTAELMDQRPDVLISVYTSLDRVQHFHWGEDCVLDWYIKMDARLNQLLLESDFLDDSDNKLIVISDHGFCSFGEAKVQTLPSKSEWGQLKGDHHEDAIVITWNIEHPIEKPQDVFYAIRAELQR